MGRIGIAVGFVHIAHYLAKEREPPFRNHCDKIDASGAVVMAVKTPFHGGFLFPSIQPLLFTCFFIHAASFLRCGKDKEKRDTGQGFAASFFKKTGAAA